MPNFKIRTTAPDKTNTNYKWGVNTEGQCTWGVYYRCKELGWKFPCTYYNGNPGYGNAKDWPEHPAEFWEVHYVSKEPDYIPVPGDICVFDGTYGHVIFLEQRVSTLDFLVSQWNMDSDEQYSSNLWTTGTKIYGKVYPTGPVKAYMHYKFNVELKPVPRNPYVEQLEVIDPYVNVRTGAGTTYKSVGYAELGFYDILEITENNNYIWCRVSDSLWIADIEDATIPIPAIAPENDTIDNLKKEITDLKKRLADISKIANGEDYE